MNLFPIYLRKINLENTVWRFSRLENYKNILWMFYFYYLSYYHNG